MAYSDPIHIEASSSDGGNTVTTGSLDTTGMDIIWIHVAHFSTSVPVVSDSKGNTYTHIVTSPVDSSARSSLYRCEGPTVGTGHTFSVDTTATGPGYPAIAVLASSGRRTAGAYNSQNTSRFDNASTVQPGSITPEEDNEILITGAACFTPDVSSINSGFTAYTTAYSAANAISGGIAYKIQTTAGAENPTWTMTGATSPGATMAAFRSQPGGGGGGGESNTSDCAATYYHGMSGQGKF